MSSHTIHRTQDLSQSLAVMNGEQSRKAKKFHRAFTNYDLLLHALDDSSIYLCDLTRVAPPKSGEDAHITCGKHDFGGATLTILSNVILQDRDGPKETTTWWALVAQRDLQ